MILVITKGIYSSCHSTLAVALMLLPKHGAAGWSCTTTSLFKQRTVEVIKIAEKLVGEKMLKKQNETSNLRSYTMYFMIL